MKMRPVYLLALITLLPAGNLFAASKEMQEMQRDIAQLQDQVRALQSSFDQKMAMIQTLLQQALDAGNKANTGVAVLSSTVNQTLDRELNTKLAPIASLAAKVDNTNNDVSEVRNQVSDLNSSINKVLQRLGDLNEAVKVLQAPAPPPPGPANVCGDALTHGQLASLDEPVFGEIVREQEPHGERAALACRHPSHFCWQPHGAFLLPRTRGAQQTARPRCRELGAGPPLSPDYRYPSRAASDPHPGRARSRRGQLSAAQ